MTGNETMGVQCDNPKCDWADLTITVSQGFGFIDKPCPKCGENLLLKEDYSNFVTLLLYSENLQQALGEGYIAPEEAVELSIHCKGGDILITPKILTLTEFVSQKEKETVEESAQWLKGAIDNARHDGDCVGQPMSCSLCQLQDYLTEYATYSRQLSQLTPKFAKTQTNMAQITDPEGYTHEDNFVMPDGYFEAARFTADNLQDIEDKAQEWNDDIAQAPLIVAYLDRIWKTNFVTSLAEYILLKLQLAGAERATATA